MVLQCRLIELGCFDHMMEWLTDHVDKVLDTSESMLRRNHTADEYLDYTSNLFNLLSLVCPTETKWGEETYYGHIMHKTNDAIIHICENGSPSPTMKRNAGGWYGYESERREEYTMAGDGWIDVICGNTLPFCPKSVCPCLVCSM